MFTLDVAPGQVLDLTDDDVRKAWDITLDDLELDVEAMSRAS